MLEAIHWRGSVQPLEHRLQTNSNGIQLGSLILRLIASSLHMLVEPGNETTNVWVVVCV